MCFSREFEGNSPLSHIGKKLPVYLQLLLEIEKKGWEVYVLTRKTYLGESLFNGAWLFNNEKFERVEKEIKIDIVFDWVGNLLFPPAKNTLKVVNTRAFKELTCDKWSAYQLLNKYMPKTFWVGDFKNAQKLLPQIKTEIVVLKPFNGLRGKGIYIGDRKGLKNFKPEKSDTKFIMQEFVDTSLGVPNVTSGKHDLRIVITNNKVIWCHVRVPASGTYLANAAQGGNLAEVDYNNVPKSVKEIVKIISENFYDKYDNPIFSLDFGIDEKGRPYIFEINDQIGFPRVEHMGKDKFITELVNNFYGKI